MCGLYVYNYCLTLSLLPLLSVKFFYRHYFCVDLNDLGIIKTDYDMAIRDKGYKDHGFNALVSLRLGNYRETLPDTRHKL